MHGIHGDPAIGIYRRSLDHISHGGSAEIPIARIRAAVLRLRTGVRRAVRHTHVPFRQLLRGACGVQKDFDASPMGPLMIFKTCFHVLDMMTT